MDSANREVQKVAQEAVAAGAYESSRRILLNIDVARKEFVAGVDVALGEFEARKALQES